jgi:hypothetical protein
MNRRCRLLAQRVVRALSAYGGFRSKQTQKLFGRPPRPAGSRSISRTSDRTTEPASGLGPFWSRSLRQEFGGIRYARFHDANNQDWSHCRLHAASPGLVLENAPATKMTNRAKCTVDDTVLRLRELFNISSSEYGDAEDDSAHTMRSHVLTRWLQFQSQRSNACR